MILVGATNDERYLTLHLGDDVTGQVLFSAKLSPDRADSLVAQMQVVIQSLDRTPIKEAHGTDDEGPAWEG
jgi:hypothetical protein